MQTVYLGLGSNTNFHNESSLTLLEKACSALKEIMEDVKVSSVYRTKPMYVEDQDDFYNMVVSGQVLDEENPFGFLKKINKIEADFGRDRAKEIRFGPRSLDIDIEIFGNQKINTEILQIPHPRVKERAFVLYPLLEVLKKNADDLLVKEYESYLKNVDSSSIEKIN